MNRSKKLLLLLLAAIVLGLFFSFRDELSLHAIAGQEIALREFQSQYATLSLIIAFIIYAIVTGASFPGAAGLSLLCGWLFGLGTGLVLVSFASTTGATIAFLMSRYFFRDFVQARLGESLRKINQAFESEGASYLFMLRLIPAVPFFVVNLAMGLTSIRTRTFWWVSQLGMLPGTVVYIYAGDSVPSVEKLAENGLSGIMTPRLWIAFGILAIFPYLIRRLYASFINSQGDSIDQADEVESTGK
ncbi:MAG: TVP38/TMEM64 family protein [Planctomycetaceae bacterium]|nr:TVP38/TMEM64 family protein [Planctomycetaceae bacterium]